MAQIIAGTYQVIREIGAGGGGIVYLATHLRLGKAVVLKADKHSLTRKPESLRREVDALKNLSHSYIPQVYDFVEEDGIVYTVIDYVEGESLDKPLGRGERFTQPLIVKWACQLLEALDYLHTQPPYGILHGDIKPANVMLTPQGDIKLIDFNIALALGAEGAVRVGFSRGYASPEHYGIDYSGLGRTQTVSAAATVITEAAETQLTGEGSLNRPQRSGSGVDYSKSSGAVLLDARSDIYSLGATLYHLFTGVRPAQDARYVTPPAELGVSAAIAAILEKAMQPNPKERYSSASEMLYDFRHLCEKDRRTIRLRKRTRAWTAAFTVLLLAGAVTTMLGLRQTERWKNALMLAEYSEEAYRKGDVTSALHYAEEALSGSGGLLDMPYTPEAQRALTRALGVYELSDHYEAHLLLTLPSEPMKVALSESGDYVAAQLQGEVRLYETECGELLASLPTAASAKADVRFCKNVLYYAGEEGLTAFSLTDRQTIWRGAPATAIACVADGSTLVTVFKDAATAIVYDAASGRETQRIDLGASTQTAPVNDAFADPEDELLALSGDGRWLAVSLTGGTLRLYDLQAGTALELYSDTAYTHFEGGFYGSYFACVATGENASAFRVFDLTGGRDTCSAQSTSPFHAFVSEEGIYISSEGVVVRVDPVSGTQTEAGFIGEDIAAFCVGGGYTVVSAESGECTIFNSYAQKAGTVESDTLLDRIAIARETAVLASRSSSDVRICKAKTHSDSVVFTYDGAYAHNEARMSSDRTTVMLYRYDGFQLYDGQGTLLCAQSFPEPESIYDQQYERTAEGCVLTVTWYDGTVRRYAASDGRCIDESKTALPDKTLMEEFITDTLRIVSPLHGAPEVYDLATGEWVRTLESNDYLTYVTQVGDCLITEYMTAQGERYGLLLDEDGAVLADLPELCDILPDGTLLFDDMQGNLRQSRVYSIQELLASAKK